MRTDHVCDWELCSRRAVGYRFYRKEGRRFHFCRPHQRRWDHGVRRNRGNYNDAWDAA